MNSPKKIVILGGGFAGIYSALSIMRHTAPGAVEITIINKTNYFLFTPMLHEVATGGLGHHQVVESIRQILHRTPISFLEANILSVDPAKREVATDQGPQAYDMLVFALGASTNFFNTPGAEEHSFVLKDLSNAIDIRNHVIERFEAASRETDPEKKKEMLSFVIVGGGATGVEFAAELAEFSERTLGKYYRKEFAGMHPRVTLVHAGAELLAPFSPSTRARAKKILEKKNVCVLLSKKVATVDPQGVTFSDGERVSAGTVIWTAGVRPNSIQTRGTELPKDPSGRIISLNTLAVQGFSNVFAIGDVAHVPDEKDAPYPMLAQIAVAEAKHLGKNIGRIISNKTPEPFRWRSKGSLVSLGHWEAAGTIAGVDVYGTFAWFIWRTVYLFKFISRSKKIKIAVDWTVHLFYPRDVTRA